MSCTVFTPRVDASAQAARELVEKRDRSTREQRHDL